MCGGVLVLGMRRSRAGVAAGPASRPQWLPRALWCRGLRGAGAARSEAPHPLPAPALSLAGGAICDHAGVDKLAFTVGGRVGGWGSHGWGLAGVAATARWPSAGAHKQRRRCQHGSPHAVPPSNSPRALAPQGSTEIGKLVGAAAARRVLPVSLELGGKSALIVDKSVNVDRVGGRCMAGQRLPQAGARLGA